MEKIVFSACLAGTNTAARWLSVGSEGDSKVVLEAAASELAQVMKLALLGGKRLKVTVEDES